MPPAQSHSLAKYADRKVNAYGVKMTPQARRQIAIKYAATDHVVDCVYADIASGLCKSAIVKRLKAGVYDGNPVKGRQASYLYNAALDRFAADRDGETERLRDVLFGRYENLLNMAIEKKDTYNARGILDSMARIFGAETQSPRQAILINGGGDKVEVNFGFDNGNQV